MGPLKGPGSFMFRRTAHFASPSSFFSIFLRFLSSNLFILLSFEAAKKDRKQVHGSSSSSREASKLKPPTTEAAAAAAAARRREDRQRRFAAPSAVDRRRRDIGATHEAENRGLKRLRPVRIGARIVPRSETTETKRSRDYFWFKSKIIFTSKGE